MNISIGVLVWIEDNSQLPELKRCLDSLVDFDVIVVNGKWNDMGGLYPESTTEANVLIDSYDNIKHIKSPNKPEYENRNTYLRWCMRSKPDFLFWVDTDEWIQMPFGRDFFERGVRDIFRGDNKSCLMHYYSDRHGGVSMQIRGIRYPFLVRHIDRHNEIFFGKVNILADPAPAPRGLVIMSDKIYRTIDREDRMIKRNKMGIH